MVDQSTTNAAGSATQSTSQNEAGGGDVLGGLMSGVMADLQRALLSVQEKLEQAEEERRAAAAEHEEIRQLAEAADHEIREASAAAEREAEETTQAAKRRAD